MLPTYLYQQLSASFQACYIKLSQRGKSQKISQIQQTNKEQKERSCFVAVQIIGAKNDSIRSLDPRNEKRKYLVLLLLRTNPTTFLTRLSIHIVAVLNKMELSIQVVVQIFFVIPTDGFNSRFAYFEKRN